MTSSSSFHGLDHLAIAVPHAEDALTIGRDQFGFPPLYREIVNQGRVRLTQLDLDHTHPQLVDSHALAEVHRPLGPRRAAPHQFLILSNP